MTKVASTGRSATATGAALGAAWGLGQAVGGFLNDAAWALLSDGNVRSLGDYSSIVAQNAIAGAEIGLAIDAATWLKPVATALPGGSILTGAVAGAVGGAGFDALTLSGSSRSWSAFAQGQVQGAEGGAIVGAGLGALGVGLSPLTSSPLIQEEAATLLSRAGSAAQGALARLPRIVLPEAKELVADELGGIGREGPVFNSGFPTKLQGRQPGIAAAVADDRNSGQILFGQESVRSRFAHGEFAGRTTGDVARAIRAGEVSPDQLPVEYIIREGEKVTLNNRSLLTLRRAGVEPTVTLDRSGDDFFESLLDSHLDGAQPSDVIRVRGGPPGSSSTE